MSIEEKRRAAFEARMNKEMAAGYAWHERDENGYHSSHVQRRWLDWNAALDSVVIELPEVHDLRYHGEFVRGMRVSARRIEEAGLKVKP